LYTSRHTEIARGRHVDILRRAERDQIATLASRRSRTQRIRRLALAFAIRSDARAERRPAAQPTG
jgi:hypothetical protein